MHSYLKTVGFSQVTRRSEIKEIIRDVIANYDEKVCVENHPEGIFVQFSKNYGSCREGIYAGACDDLRIGVTMIFYLQNRRI